MVILLDHGSAMLYLWQKWDQRAAIFLPEEPVSMETSFRAHLLILKTLLIRSDLLTQLFDQTRCTAS